MKNEKELYEALLAGLKITVVDWPSAHFVRLNADGRIVDQDGLYTTFLLTDISAARIWNPSVTSKLIIRRIDRETAKRDLNFARDRDRLESFVRDYNPAFVPVWGGEYYFIYEGSQGWNYVLGAWDEPGRVPFPDKASARFACNSLDSGKLRIMK